MKIPALLPAAFAALALGAAPLDYSQYFESLNALALCQLGLPPPAVSVPAPSREYLRPCPACGGKGELALQEPNFGQRDGRLGKGRIHRRRCPLCDGRRNLRAYLLEATLVKGAADGYAAFSASHLARGDIKTGYAFVPREIFSSASRHDLKRVESAFQKPCPKCKWTGLDWCKHCDGNGFRPCKNKDCRGGWDVERHKKHSRHGHARDIVEVELCDECEGAALRLCSHCDGRGAKPCHHCGGTGVKH